MKLLYSPASPYVRKVSVVADETGLSDSIELVPTNVWDPSTDITATNPLGKIPALITDEGLTLFDSRVICEYLDSLQDGRKLFPTAGPIRWAALRKLAIGDGIVDLAILRRSEGRRAKAEQSLSWVQQKKAEIGRALDRLEDEANSLADEVTIGQIAIGCALGYLDFRFVEDNWRDGRPALANWFEIFAARSSMTATVPRELS